MTIRSDEQNNLPAAQSDSETSLEAGPETSNLDSEDVLSENPSSTNTAEHSQIEKEPTEESEVIEIDLLEAIEDDRDESAFAKKNVIKSISRFDELTLNPDVMEAVKQLGWVNPTPVQGLCLPYTLQGRDVAGFAQTGTGKTGVFLITVAEAAMKARASQQGQKPTSPLAVVLAPTRELAVQIHEEVEKLAEKLSIKSLAVFGGMDYDKQAQSLRSGVDIVIATPGRLKDYIQKKVVSIKDTSLFVCDEVDRMFDMGFIEDVEFFLEFLPEKCQKLLFSATTNDKVKELAFEYLNNPEYISVNPEEITPESIEQHLILCDTPEKLRVLMGLLKEHLPKRAVIFTNTKLTAEWLKHKLRGNGFEVDSITGDMAQKKRISLIRRIKAGEIKLLIGTDVASRGLHISDVSHVYNFDLPAEPANYVHRIGRTARAGAKGQSFSLVCEEYAENLDGIKKYVGESLPACQWFDPNFLEIPDHSGNPFHDGKVRGFAVSDRKSGGRPQRGPRDQKFRTDRSPDRGQEARGDKGFDRSRGKGSPKSDRPGAQNRFDRGEKDFSTNRPSRGDGPRDSQNNQSRNKHRRDQTGTRDHRSRDHDTRQGGGRQRSDWNQKQARQHPSAHRQGAVAKQDKTVPNQGFFSMLAKVFKSLFGIK